MAWAGSIRKRRTKIPSQADRAAEPGGPAAGPSGHGRSSSPLLAAEGSRAPGRTGPGTGAEAGAPPRRSWRGRKPSLGLPSGVENAAEHSVSQGREAPRAAQGKPRGLDPPPREAAGLEEAPQRSPETAVRREERGADAAVRGTGAAPAWSRSPALVLGGTAGGAGRSHSAPSGSAAGAGSSPRPWRGSLPLLPPIPYRAERHGCRWLPSAPGLGPPPPLRLYPSLPAALRRGRLWRRGSGKLRWATGGGRGAGKPLSRAAGPAHRARPAARRELERRRPARRFGVGRPGGAGAEAAAGRRRVPSGLPAGDRGAVLPGAPRAARGGARRRCEGRCGVGGRENPLVLSRGRWGCARARAAAGCGWGPPRPGPLLGLPSKEPGAAPLAARLFAAVFVAAVCSRPRWVRGRQVLR